MPLDRTKLLPASRQLADRLFAFAPDVQAYATMEQDAPESGSFQLLVTIPSPTGDAHGHLGSARRLLTTGPTVW